MISKKRRFDDGDDHVAMIASKKSTFTAVDDSITIDSSSDESGEPIEFVATNSAGGSAVSRWYCHKSGNISQFWQFLRNI